MAQLKFDNFRITVPSIGEVRFRDIANHPELADEATQVGLRFIRFGAALDDNFVNCRSAADHMDRALDREVKKWPDRSNPRKEDIDSARAAAKAEMDEIQQDRRREFDDTTFLLTADGRRVGVWSISETHVMRIRDGVRHLQGRSLLLQAVRGPIDFQAYADASYEIWLELLRQQSLSVAHGPPVKFQRWHFPNEKRKSHIISLIQARLAGGELDTVSWPTDADEDALGIIRTKYVTLRRGR